MNDDLISREALKKLMWDESYPIATFTECGTEVARIGLTINEIEQIIDNAPTVEYPEPITIKCDTEEDKQKLLSALRNVKLKAIIEEERPQGDWIPVSERLPDYMEDILVTFQKPNREPLVYRAVFIGGKFALDNGDTWNWNDLEIKAWMPLPEAYKEE